MAKRVLRGFDEICSVWKNGVNVLIRYFFSYLWVLGQNPSRFGMPASASPQRKKQKTKKKTAIEILWSTEGIDSQFQGLHAYLFNRSNVPDCRLQPLRYICLSHQMNYWTPVDEAGLGTGATERSRPRPAWASCFYWGQLPPCCAALPAPAGWQARCTPPARRFPAEPPSPGASHAHLQVQSGHIEGTKKRGKLSDKWSKETNLSACGLKQVLHSERVSPMHLYQWREKKNWLCHRNNCKKEVWASFNQVSCSGKLAQQNYSWLLPTLPNSTQI